MAVAHAPRDTQFHHPIAILILTGRGTEQLALASPTARRRFRVAPDLSAAIELVLDRAIVAR